jgi:hypothetical protein
LTSSRATVAGAQGGEPLTQTHHKSCLFTKHSTTVSNFTFNSAIPNLSSVHANASTRPSLSSQTNLVPIKGFVREVLRQSRTSGSILQMALCYLEAIRAKVPELVEREKWETESKENQIYRERLCKATDTDSTEPEAMATVKVVDSDNAPRGASSLTSQLSTSNPDFTLSGLKSHLVQNLIKKPKVPTSPLLPSAPLVFHD